MISAYLQFTMPHQPESINGVTVLVIIQSFLTFLPQLFIEDLSNKKESYLHLPQSVSHISTKQS